MWHSRPRLCLPAARPRNTHSRGRLCHITFPPETDGLPSAGVHGRGWYNSPRDLAPFLDGRLPFGPIQNPLFRRVADPLLGLYWRAVRRWV